MVGLAGRSRPPGRGLRGWWTDAILIPVVVRAAPRSVSGYRSLPLLLALGAVLTVGDIRLVVLLTATTPPVWLWSQLSVSLWGPFAALIVWGVLYQHRRWVDRTRATGLTGRAVIRSVDGTRSVVNGRPVLRFTLDAGPSRPVGDVIRARG